MPSLINLISRLHCVLYILCYENGNGLRGLMQPCGGDLFRFIEWSIQRIGIKKNHEKALCLFSMFGYGLNHF